MASGIAEHHEARRREVRYLQKAWVQQKNMESGQADREGMTVAEMVQHGLPGNSQRNDTYADQLRHMAAPGCGGQKLTDSAVDRQIRADYRQKQEGEYSAKLPNRYNSTKYLMQW